MGGVVLLGLVGARPAAGQAAGAPEPGSQLDEASRKASEAWNRGIQLKSENNYLGALAAFEDATAILDVPATQYEVGLCDLALNRYVVLRRIAQRLIDHAAVLGPDKQGEIRGWRAVADENIVRLTVRLDPASAALSVDGEALVADDHEPDTFLAGVGSKGPAQPVGKTSFTLLLDPKEHVFRASRPGHVDAVVTREYRASDHAPHLDLNLDVLPATLAIRSTPVGASVQIDRRDVGLAPVRIARPAGSYRLELALDGYESSDERVALMPGQELTLTRSLRHPPITKRWWFWTGVVAAVAAGVFITYEVTRPAPQPPPYDMGTANWLAHPQAFPW